MNAEETNKIYTVALLVPPFFKKTGYLVAPFCTFSHFFTFLHVFAPFCIILNLYDELVQIHNFFLGVIPCVEIYQENLLITSLYLTMSCLVAYYKIIIIPNLSRKNLK